MAQITIEYTPQTNSDSESPAMCHRICYRQSDASPSEDYCCLIDDTTSTAGVPKTFTITISEAPCAVIPSPVPEDCDTLVYEGYVQACCEDESSLSGRVTWTAAFEPNPSCVNKLVCCQSQLALSSSDIVITDGGTAYTPGDKVVVIIRDPLDPVPPGGGNDGSITVTATGGGVITAGVVTSGGLYGRIPTLIMPSSEGLGGQATAVLIIPCIKPPYPTPAYKGDCIESPMGITEVTLLLGQCANMCFPSEFPFVYNSSILTGSPNTTNYNYTTGGCCDCTTCRDYTVITGSELSEINLTYTVCSTDPTGEQQTNTVSGSGSHILTCVVPGSIYCTSDPEAILSISDAGQGSCCIS